MAVIYDMGKMGENRRVNPFDANEQDRQKFEQIHNTYGKLLLSIARGILGNDEADDAYQRCLIRIFKNIRKIGDVPDLTTRGFVCKIMKNEAIRLYNASASRKANEVSLEGMGHDGASIAESAFFEQLAFDGIASCFNKLSKDDRRILALRHISGYSNSDLEKILNLPGQTVRKRISRAQKRLGVMLAEEGLI